MITKEQEDILDFIEDLAAARLDTAFEQNIKTKKLSYFYEYEIIKEVYEAIYLHLTKKGEDHA